MNFENVLKENAANFMFFQRGILIVIKNCPIVTKLIKNYLNIKNLKFS